MLGSKPLLPRRPSPISEKPRGPSQEALEIFNDKHSDSAVDADTDNELRDESGSLEGENHYHDEEIQDLDRFGHVAEMEMGKKKKLEEDGHKGRHESWEWMRHVH